MKAILILLISIIIVSNGLAQKTKKVAIKKGYPSYKEVFYVLKSDKKIKHGAFKVKFHGKTLIKGQYFENNPTGIWEYFNINEELAHKLNIVTKELMFDKYEEDNLTFDKEKYSRPIIILGGLGTIYYQLVHVIKFPVNAIKSGTNTSLILNVVFDTKGEIRKLTIKESCGSEIEKAVEEAINLIDVHALPALDINGNPTESEIDIPVSFKTG